MKDCSFPDAAKGIGSNQSIAAAKKPQDAERLTAAPYWREKTKQSRPSGLANEATQRPPEAVFFGNT